VASSAGVNSVEDEEMEPGGKIPDKKRLKDSERTRGAAKRCREKRFTRLECGKARYSRRR